MKLSVILPIYNEQDNILVLYKKLSQILPNEVSSYEIIFIDDGSSDSSLKLIKSLRRKDTHVKLISFSRNFGHMPAITAGLTYSKGDKVIVMDADLQDPPEIIPKLLKVSRKVEVVYAVKKKRKENFIKRAMFQLFYFIQTNTADLPIPTNAGTFSLLDRKVVNIIKNLPEKNKFFSGLRVWSGYTQASIEYERAARVAGEKNSFRKLLKLAVDGIFSFSYVPLRLASVLGFVIAATAFVFTLIVFVLRVYFDWGMIGWASTLSAILLIGGIQLITLGIIGEYLARIYDEVKQRPEYVIAEKVGFKK